MIAQDKLEHLAVGALLASAVSAFSTIGFAVMTVLFAAVIKEGLDAINNWVRKEDGLAPKHTVDLFDAVATLVGGAIVLFPQIVTKLA